MQNDLMARAPVIFDSVFCLAQRIPFRQRVGNATIQSKESCRPVRGQGDSVV